MRLGVLTSSRSDYGIYVPLLKAIKESRYFDLTVMAFGTHLSALHGYTISHIYEEKYYDRVIEVNTMPSGDTPYSISEAMGNTILSFSPVWRDNRFDLVLCLGDRYEMFAACASAMPFNVQLGHISGGEQTLGAIDDAFRHSITHMSAFHFTSTEEYRERVTQLKSDSQHVYNTGALNIDNIANMNLLSPDEFKEQFHIDLRIPTILITFHPETISFERNKYYVSQLIQALQEVKEYQMVITMPNADTMGNMIREQLREFISGSSNAIGVESLGVLGYLSCMKHCSFMLGNTSSGFVEASYFPKYVINLGDRQTGRIVTGNIRNCRIEAGEILAAINAYKTFELSSPVSIYGDGKASAKIVDILKSEF